jgi:ATP-dependent protease HslVU (ClpYQ) ATPase subunit
MSDQLPLLPGSQPFEHDARAEFHAARAVLGSLVVGREELLDQLTLTLLLHRTGRASARMLISGPSGSGKTHIALAMAAVLGAKALVIQASDVVEKGWTGTSLTDHLSGWHRSIGTAAAERGVVIIDEICKIRRHPESHGNAIDKYRNQQSSFLALCGVGTPLALDGDTTLDLRHALVIATGAFSDAPWSQSGQTPTSQDLVAYGLIPELVDRLTDRIALTPAPAESLVQIYSDVVAGIQAELAPLAQSLGYDLTIDPATFRYVAKAVVAGGNGAGPRLGAGWLAAAARHMIVRALRAGLPRGTALLVTPDDVSALMR